MGKSTRRVAAAIEAAGLDCEIVTMPDSVRTAADAARAVDCAVGQIAKSMIFEGEQSGALRLLVVSGAHDVPLDRAADLFGEPLARADPNRVRKETGFAIGGVAPIGHLSEIETWMDQALMQYPVVWAAGGAPHALFAILPQDLARITGARPFEIAG
ncbi:MAG: YbaK/EbsC family protein [Sulfitobacter sp.]|nr:YbaK/EbsC family protein [Sulfitobacter sp.]